MLKPILYTVITGGYDTFKPIPIELGVAKDFDCLLFSDKDIKVEGWQTILVNQGLLSNVKTQRLLKIMGVHGKAIYIDGSYRVVKNPKPLLKYTEPITLARHPNRTNYIQEARACIKIKKDAERVINRQLEEYQLTNNFIDGLWMTGIMITNNLSIDFKKDWCSEIIKHSHRDQISLPIAATRNKLKINTVEWQELLKYFSLNPHKK